MRRIIIVNSKGGCGKTTVATNLASFYAERGVSTALLDHDPQGSSAAWLDMRPSERPSIHGIAAYARVKASLTRSWQFRLPPETRRVIIDTPAGLDRPQLFEHLRGVDLVLVPVIPSAIDIRAAATFLHELLAVTKGDRARVAVVANRVRENCLGLPALERFVQSLNLPMVAQLDDDTRYLHAAELGLGVHELESNQPGSSASWERLHDWLEAEQMRASQIATA